ncbi:RNA polymerase sigma factor [Sinomicrobium sp.]
MSQYYNHTQFVNALKNGENEAYDFLVKQYHQRLCVYAYGLVHDYSQAEDIVQNIYLKVWKQRQKLRADLNLKHFLYKAVYNEFINQYKKQRTVIELEKKYIDTLKTIIEEDEKALLNLIPLVWKAVQDLPPKCKEVFILSKKDGLTNVEIADHLNVTTKAVESQITKAFNIIRKKLGDKANNVFYILFGYRTGYC